MNRYPIILLAMCLAIISACQADKQDDEASRPSASDTLSTQVGPLVVQYAPFRLTANLKHLSARQKKLLANLIDASKYMDTLFTWQAYGDPHELYSMDVPDVVMKYLHINYGSWDRLNGNEPFLPGVGKKPQGPNFYPTDMTKAEFEAADLSNKSSQYTLLRRDADDQLETAWYHDEYKPVLQKVSNLLVEAAELAKSKGFKKYLELRSEAILNDQYYESDKAWLQMEDNDIDVIIGPIETYEDELFGYKTGYEAYVLVKDREWSSRLQQYAQFLPYLQEGLPVDAQYKQDKPGRNAQLNAYDVVYYAGHSNAGSKTIAINLPNSERLQKEIGSRRLQLKNAMRAKFDKILVPISETLIHPDHRQHITFDAFFGNTMFHEVAHGLGVKNVVDDTVTVRQALKGHASAIEEGKADVLGIYMITRLKDDKGELEDVSLEEYYSTFMASIFRSIRFGSSSAHGVANLIRFNYFKEKGAFVRDKNGHYRVDMEKFREAIDALSNKILTLQGNGDYEATQAFVDEYGTKTPTLEEDLQRVNEAGIPVDITFEQGKQVLGL